MPPGDATALAEAMTALAEPAGREQVQRMVTACRAGRSADHNGRQQRGFEQMAAEFEELYLAAGC